MQTPSTERALIALLARAFNSLPSVPYCYAAQARSAMNDALTAYYGDGDEEKATALANRVLDLAARA